MEARLVQIRRGEPALFELGERVACCLAAPRGKARVMQCTGGKANRLEVLGGECCLPELSRRVTDNCTEASGVECSVRSRG